jgi:hypothetical protein
MAVLSRWRGLAPTFTEHKHWGGVHQAAEATDADVANLDTVNKSENDGLCEVR